MYEYYRFQVVHSVLTEPSAYAEDPVDYERPPYGIPDNLGVKIDPQVIE
jgi:hypothetical protein